MFKFQYKQKDCKNIEQLKILHDKIITNKASHDEIKSYVCKFSTFEFLESLIIDIMFSGEELENHIDDLLLIMEIADNKTLIINKIIQCGSYYQLKFLMTSIIKLDEINIDDIVLTDIFVQMINDNFPLIDLSFANIGSVRYDTIYNYVNTKENISNVTINNIINYIYIGNGMDKSNSLKLFYEVIMRKKEDKNFLKSKEDIFISIYNRVSIYTNDFENLYECVWLFPDTFDKILLKMMMSKTFYSSDMDFTEFNNNMISHIVNHDKWFEMCFIEKSLFEILYVVIEHEYNKDIYSRIIEYSLLKDYIKIISYIKNLSIADKEIIEVRDKLLSICGCSNFSLLYAGILYGVFIEDSFTAQFIISELVKYNYDKHYKKYYDELVSHVACIFPNYATETCGLIFDENKKKSARK